MKSYPAKFKSFLQKIVPMGALQKLQNSIQILIILWLVYPIHTNSLFQVIFEELPFCHFSPPNTSILGIDSQIQLIFHLNILVFQTNGKQPYSSPVLSRFCNCLCGLGLILVWCQMLDSRVGLCLSLRVFLSSLCSLIFPPYGKTKFLVPIGTGLWLPL